MHFPRQAGVVLALSLLVSSIAAAQARGAPSARKPIEIGTDAELRFSLEDPGFTRLMAPVSMIRVGIHTSDAISIEPFGRIFYLKPEDVDGITAYSFGAGLLYHFSPDRTRSQVYVRPFVQLDGGTGVDSEIGGGVGLGMKLRPRLNGRLQWRTEANFFSIDEATSLNLLFGVSIYPR